MSGSRAPFRFRDLGFRWCSKPLTTEAVNLEPFDASGYSIAFPRLKSLDVGIRVVRGMYVFPSAAVVRCGFQ